MKIVLLFLIIATAFCESVHADFEIRDYNSIASDFFKDLNDLGIEKFGTGRASIRTSALAELSKNVHFVEIDKLKKYYFSARHTAFYEKCQNTVYIVKNSDISDEILRPLIVHEILGALCLMDDTNANVSVLLEVFYQNVQKYRSTQNPIDLEMVNAQKRILDSYFDERFTERPASTFQHLALYNDKIEIDGGDVSGGGGDNHLMLLKLNILLKMFSKEVFNFNTNTSLEDGKAFVDFIGEILKLNIEVSTIILVQDIEYYWEADKKFPALILVPHTMDLEAATNDILCLALKIRNTTSRVRAKDNNYYECKP